MKARQPAVQRAAAFVHLPPLLEEFGVSIEAVLTGTGVSAGDLRPDRFIPFSAALEILERSADLTGQDDIGLRLGLKQHARDMGPAGEVMRRAATLGEALADFAAFQISNSTGAAVFLLRERDEVMLGYGIYDADNAASSQVQDLVLGVGHNLACELSNGAVRPVEYYSMRPPPEDSTPWRALGAPVRFGADRTVLFFSRAAMAFPLPGADRDARDATLARLQQHFLAGSWGWTERTRHAMRSLLLDGCSKMAQVARHLGVHPRTLQRALRREGTSFDAIKDEVRYAVARELLTLTPLPIGDLAVTLDFGSASAFIRAFQRWSGTSPDAWRRRSAGSGIGGEASHALRPTGTRRTGP